LLITEETCLPRRRRLNYFMLRIFLSFIYQLFSSDQHPASGI